MTQQSANNAAITPLPIPVSADSPLSFSKTDAYKKWRDEKLAAYPANVSDLVVEVNDPGQLSASEKSEIRRRCQTYNMALFQCRNPADLDHPSVPRVIGQQFGLNRLDHNVLSDDYGITPIEVMEGNHEQGYIPYTNLRLLWHTDGYYNLPVNTIRVVILYCARPAPTGGENQLLDPEIVYIRLMEEDPSLIQTLMQDDMYIIPGHVTKLYGKDRGDQKAPVFTLDPQTHHLNMRFTNRMRNINWRSDERALYAVERLKETISDCNQYVITHTMQSGEGLICNNVLHNRAAFEDGAEPHQRRLMYRARYYDDMS